MLRQQCRCSELEIGASYTHCQLLAVSLAQVHNIHFQWWKHPCSLSNLNMEFTGNQGKVRCAWSTQEFGVCCYNAQNSDADKARLLSQTCDQCILWCQTNGSIWVTNPREQWCAWGIFCRYICVAVPSPRSKMALLTPHWDKPGVMPTLEVPAGAQHHFTHKCLCLSGPALNLR